MTSRPRVFLDVSIGQEPAGRLTIELFADKTPKTCENFRQLCTGEHASLSYAKAPFHRVIDEFMVQGGDIENGDGTGTTSIYNGEFEDENLDWREMDAAGLVCSANRGKDTNGSQFFLTLEPCEHLNGKHTIFGQLVAGEDVLARMAKISVDKNDRPIEPVLISRCGELEKRKKNREPEQKHTSSSITTDDRGRRRTSGQDGSDDMNEDTPVPERERRKRRQSEHVVDEGIRGRPRLRSSSRSPSNPIEEDDEDMSEHSPAKMHKRKRSPSPSRRVERRPEETGDQVRRRRSLPNQYQYANGSGRRHEDEDRYRPSPRRADEHYRYGGKRRDHDSYRPSHDRYGDSGRLGNDDRMGGDYDEYEPPIKFKGRGAMKYREPDRAW